MGKLTDDQAKALAELEALRDAPDADEEYEVLVATPDGHQMRLPWSKVPKTWRERFGFTDPAAEAGEGDEGGAGEGGDGKPGKEKDPKPPSSNRYFK